MIKIWKFLIQSETYRKTEKIGIISASFHIQYKQ